MSVPMFSIIVPVYKAEKYIDECINSILEQDFADFELILVDDGSPDGCGRIIDGYASADKRIKVVHKKNEGVACARNTALRLARGDYIVNVDADDYLMPGTLKILKNNINSYRADVYLFGFLMHENGVFTENIPDIDEGIYEDSESKDRLYRKIVYDKAKPFFTFGVYPSLAVRIVRRELFCDCAFGIDESIEIGEDFAITLPIMLKAKKICFIKKPLYVYRIVEGSASHRFNINTMHFFASMLRGFERSIKDIEKYELKSQLGAYAVFVMFNYLFSYISGGNSYEEYCGAIKETDEIVYRYIKYCRYNFRDLRAVFMITLIKFKLRRVLWLYAKVRGNA